MSEPIDIPPEIFGETDGQIIESVGYDFGLTRRIFVAALGHRHGFRPGAARTDRVRRRANHERIVLPI
jgi:hypothetical protein